MYCLTTLVALVAAITSTVRAEDAIGFADGNGGVRGYDASVDHAPPAASIITLSEPQGRASLGSPAVLAIVVGCVAAVALALALAYRSRKTMEPSTPREDEDADTSNSVLSSTKSIAAQYQQSFDGPASKKPLEPHSPRMPPPKLAAIGLSNAQQQQQQRLAARSPGLDTQLVDETRPVDVVVVAM